MARDIHKARQKLLLSEYIITWIHHWVQMHYRRTT